MIIKVLWVMCSLFVFRYALKAFIKSEIDTFGSIDAMLLFLFTLLAFIISLFGPVAIIAFIGYNVLEGIAKSITEGHKK